MKITRRTRTKDIAPLMNEERMRQLAEDVPAVPLDTPLLSMTCGEFIEALDEAFVTSFFREKRALRAFGKYREYLSELEEITRYLKRYEVEQSSEEKAASVGVRFPSLAERILLDTVRFYGLHSTAEAERMPVTDWLLVVKSEGAAAQYQHNLSKLQKPKPSNAKH